MANDETGGKKTAAWRQLDPTRLIPELCSRYFEFFRPGHREGVLAARIEEPARLHR
jgi:hypothetical protein